MRVNSEENVDVRFFGAHDRAWIPLKDVFLYSEEPPVQVKKTKKSNMDGCVNEVDMYIKNISDKFGKFEFASQKTNLDPKKEEEQIRILYPKVRGSGKNARANGQLMLGRVFGLFYWL